MSCKYWFINAFEITSIVVKTIPILVFLTWGIIEGPCPIPKTDNCTAFIPWTLLLFWGVPCLFLYPTNIYAILLVKRTERKDKENDSSMLLDERDAAHAYFDKMYKRIWIYRIF